MVTIKSLLVLLALFQLTNGQDDGNPLFSYLCDENNEELDTDKPIDEGEEIRVCMERGRSAINNDLYIMKINTFEFFKTTESSSTVVQRVFDHGAPTNSETGETRLEVCPPGAVKCSFTTKLKAQFFDEDGTVKGIGTVALQNGQGRREMAEISLANNNYNHRQAQEFYGMTSVSMEFAVEDGINKNPIKYARWTFKDHWEESPDHIQGLYITGLVVAVLICFCFCAGLILWRQCCADVVTRTLRGSRGVEDPDPIFVYAKRQKKEDRDISETHSVDDDLEMSTDGDEEEDDDVESLERLTYENTTPNERPASTRSASTRSTEKPPSEKQPSLLALEPAPSVVSERGMVAYDEEDNIPRSSRRSTSSRRSMN